MIALGRQLTQGLLHLIYPGVCGACGRLLNPSQDGFCLECHAALTCDAFAACPRCAGSIGPHALIEGGCQRCRHIHFHFNRAIRLGPYQGLLREMILRLKQATGEMLAELLASLWVEQTMPAFQELQAEVVIPVPLHWRRRFRRGYNQSEALARVVAKGLDLPCRPGWLRRVRYTPEQTRQTPSGRWDNVRGAFRSRSGAAVKNKAILLVDDVLTTGGTCSEAARALKLGGASRVEVAVLAHSQT